MIYKISFSEEADADIKALKKSQPQAYKKLIKLLLELQKHPTEGTGHPKPLGGDRNGEWSRRISNKHRLVYKILEEKVLILVLAAYGHYDDK